MNKRILAFTMLFTMVLLLGGFYNNQVVDPEIINKIDKYSVSADGDNWLVGYGYREKLNFWEQTGAGEGYQIKLTVDYDTGDDASNIVYTDGNSRSDFGDIRFTDYTGDEELAYWIEELTDGDDATFWFKMTDDLGVYGRAYIYYGNAGATTTSSLTGTFLAGTDGSEAPSTNLEEGTWASDGDYIYASSYGAGAAWHGPETDYENEFTFADTNGIRIRTRWDFDCDASGSVVGHVGIQIKNAAGTNLAQLLIGDHWGSTNSLQHFLVVDGYSYTSGATGDYTDWTGTTEGRIYENAGTDAWAYIDDVQKSATDEDHSITYSAMTIMMEGLSTDPAPIQRIDWVFVSKFQTSEPYVNTVSTEETATIANVGAEVTNVDETTYLVAQKREYVLTSNTTMQSGYVDIDAVRIFLETAAPATVFTFKYDQDADTFSLVSGTVTLVTESCVDVGAGISLDLTFVFTVPWAHDNLADLQIRMVSTDDWEGSDEDYYGDYDIETRLDITTRSTSDGFGTGARGDYDTVGSITTQGIVVYYLSTVHPPADEIDIWGTCPNTPDPNWESSDYDDSDGTYTIVMDSDDEVGIDPYYTIAVQESAGAGGADEMHSTHSSNYIADRVQVQSYSSDDARINIGTASGCHVTLYYDYLNQDVEDGTVTVNGVVAAYSGADGIWDFDETEAAVTGTTYNDVNYTGGTHGITKEDQNSQDLLQVWDRIYAISLSYDGDTRVDMSTSINFDYELHYDYDEADVTDGTITVNGESFTHQGSGIWRYTTNGGGIVGDITFDSIVASGNTHGITEIFMNSKTVTLIWDRVQVQSYSVSDARDNINENVNIDVLLWYDYDDTQVTDGTVTINGFAASHQGSGVWRITRTSASVTSVTYNTVAATGNTHGITVEDQNGKSQQVIWDRVKVLLIVSNSTYLEIGDYVLLTVGLEYEFDHAAITAGTFSLRYGSTYLTLTHDASGNWTVTDSSASATSRTYNFVNGTATLHGITVVNMDSKTVTVHWGRIILVVTINDGWTVIGYNVTITITGTYEGTGWIWNGTATFNSTWTAPFYPEQSTAGNYSFVVTSITNDDMDLIGFTVNTVYCVWDDIIMSSDPAYKWTQYSPDEVWLIIDTAKFTWAINGTNALDALIQTQINGTDDDWGIVNTDGYIGDLILGGNPTTKAFDTSWYYANISIYAQIDGYDWILWTRMLTVDILHSMQIVDSGFYLTDDWVIITIQINWNNGTFFVWDNVTGTPVLVGASYMGSYPFARSSVIGLHTLIVLVNGTHGTLDSSAQIADGVDTDGWEYLEFPYTINPVTFSITNLMMLQNNESIIVAGTWHTPNTTLTWEAYEAGVLIDSGVLTLAASGEYNSIYWLKNEPTAFNNFTLSITADGSTINLHSYSLVLDSATYLSTVNAPIIVYEGDTYLDESTAYENPPGFYITAEIAAVIAVCGVFIAFLAYLFADRLLKKKRLDVESEGS